MVTDVWYVRVVKTEVNSIGRAFRTAYRMTFHSLRDAFEYYVDRNYLLGCTDKVPTGRRLRWSIEAPTREMPLIMDFDRYKTIQDYQVDW